jgi:hypothetical protein
MAMNQNVPKKERFFKQVKITSMDEVYVGVGLEIGRRLTTLAKPSLLRFAENAKRPPDFAAVGKVA